MEINVTGDVANETVQKWSPVLEGIESEYTKRVTAQLLENQAKAIISEKVRMDEDVAQGIGGTTTTTRLGAFQKFAFPLVRRVYPELIANNIVGVQPMQGPVSQIFYLGNSRRDGLAGTPEQAIYSKYNLTYRGLTAGQIMASGTGNYATDGTSTGPGLPDGAPGVGFDVSDIMNATSGAPSTPIGGKIADFPTPGKMRGLATGPASLLGFNVSAGERLEGSGIPEMMFNIEQQPVAARTRKMRALWTLEASQDLRAYHNLDLEQELTDLLGKELRLEIDRQIVEDLRMLAYGINKIGEYGNSGNDTFWNARNLDQSYAGDTGTNFKFEPDFTGASSMDYDFTGRYTHNKPKDYDNVFLIDFSDSTLGFAPQHVGHVYANLMALCHRAATDIYKSTLRGPGNFIVTSPTVAAMLHAAARMEGGVQNVDGPTNMNGARVEYRGKLGGQFDLYVDPLYPEDEIMVGYKGANAMDSGYVYAPYIPLQQTPTITDPETFQPRKGIITRYGKAAVAPASRFYRIIRLIGPTANYLFTPFVAVKNNSWA